MRRNRPLTPNGNRRSVLRVSPSQRPSALTPATIRRRRPERPHRLRVDATAILGPGGLPSGHARTKRALDVGLALVLLLMVTPVLLIAALVIRCLDPRSPVLFRQTRVGRGGKSFQLLKLRTMVPDADGQKEALRSRSEVAWPDFRVRDDPRVTRVGRTLRRSSIDELPQLVNVLRGDMSLVGPRPTSFAASTYETWQLERLEVRPGLTGPWQLDGRGTLDFTERCRLEISFLREPSLRRDLVLLARTPLVVLRRTGIA